MLLSSAKTLWFPLIGAGCRKNKTTSRGISWMLECTLRIYIYRGEPIKKNRTNTTDARHTTKFVALV